MNTINTNKALDLIKQSNGRTFSVVFLKKDGSRRVLNGRMGVKKGLTGGGMAYDPTIRGLLPVYDMKAKGYRMVTIANIQGLKINKTQYVVTDQSQKEPENVSLWNIIVNFFKGC